MDAGKKSVSSQSIARARLAGMAPAPLRRRPRAPLTQRERRVLTELALGRTTDEMAATIYLSPHTVRSHIKSAMRKLGARTRAQAVALALADGSIEVDLAAAPG